ncbi:hypothetical protein GWI33_021027 [Rhynchophorus ferrugineus]|uniref:GH18 domain-containing protein n=1 Tax=Rhynchophorus ferrugineus TaxID=354439 RepID=A0A834LZZ9_RHYFE|nr:hypothetical protein GWI33_021027 [Rhynchophorus ferrugineus]
MAKCVLLLFVILCGFLIADSRYVGGYYFSSASNTLKISDINPDLLTHIYYAFVAVNADGSVTIQNEKKGFVKPLAELKNSNPDLKLLFCLVTSDGSFTKVAANETLRAALIKNSYQLLVDYNYDGIDIDWEFPTSSDLENFSALLKEFSEEFKKYDYLLTAAVNPIPTKSYGYDVPVMAKYLDIINIMTYDFYGSWSAHTGLHSGLYPSSLDNAYEKKYLNVESSIKNWANAGASKDILAVGIPFYGRSFKLKDASNHGIHDLINGTVSPSTPTYLQIVKNYNDYNTVWDEEQQGYYKYLDTTWVSYDEERSVQLKAAYCVEQGVKGIFTWHLGADDVQGEYSGVKQTLLQAMNDGLNIARK